MLAVNYSAHRIADQPIFKRFVFDRVRNAPVGIKGSFGVAVFDKFNASKKPTPTNIAHIAMLTKRLV